MHKKNCIWKDFQKSMPSGSSSIERKYFWHASISFWNKQFLITTKTCLFLLHCVKCVQIRSIFWSVFSRIRTEYGDILCIPPYSVRMWENPDQKKLRIWTLFTQCFRSEDWNSKSQFFLETIWNLGLIVELFEISCLFLIFFQANAVFFSHLSMLILLYFV